MTLDNKEFCDKSQAENTTEKLDESEICEDTLYSINTEPNNLSENVLVEKQIMLEMIAQMKELTEAVNKLCKQTEVGYNSLTTDQSTGISENSDKDNEEIGKKSKKPKRKRIALIGEIFFYSLLVALILGAFLIRSSSNGRPISMAGYSAFTVLTSSMESEIPKGSLVITKTVEPETLKIGDDITYMSGPTSTITHRIIGITEKYLDTNERAFETQGVMNASPDKEPVPAVNVVGKVVYHSETLGQIATFTSKNWPFLIFILIVSIALFTILKKVLRSDNQSKNDKLPAKPQNSNVDTE